VCCLGANSDDFPALTFDVHLTLGVVFGAAREVMHAPVNFYRDTRTADCEVDSIAPNVVLANDMDSVFSQST
jgi:hypothetical protein